MSGHKHNVACSFGSPTCPLFGQTPTAFKDLKPGDKFDMERPGHIVTGVCVIAPALIESKRRLFRKTATTYHARCIELHPLRGAVEWNPKESGDLIVQVYSPGASS